MAKKEEEKVEAPVEAPKGKSNREKAWEDFCDLVLENARIKEKSREKSMGTSYIVMAEEDIARGMPDSFRPDLA